MTATQPRPEYPRPQFRRERWHNLNGTWRFAFDDADAGLDERWYAAEAVSLDGGPFDRTITVPFVYQAERSGVGDRALHDVVWYARTFDDVRVAGERLLLRFGAVHYQATVWVNGERVADHEGGQSPFAADVTSVLRPAGNVVVVRVGDPHTDLTIPRGKRYWAETGEGIFYTPSTGIWQTVWLEPVPAMRLGESFVIRPDLGTAAVDLDAEVEGLRPGTILRVVVSLDDDVLVDDRFALLDASLQRRLPLRPRRGRVGANVADDHGLALWSPEEPNLYDMRLELLDAQGRLVDAVDTYFGMRTITAHDGQVLLNGRPYYQRLVLDQGSFPGGLLTAATDADLRADIELAKDLGFNGARKHQKAEDPRWLYWADRLGFLVWAEMASAYRFSDDAARRTLVQWPEVVRRDRNHPCVVVWVPVNESWGVPGLAHDPRQVAHLLALYHTTRTLDSSRLVVSNDGWEHATGDLLTIHEYGDAAALAARCRSRASAGASRPGGHPLHVPGFGDDGAPLLVTEFGGIAADPDAQSWGYHSERGGRALAQRYAEFVAALLASDVVQGFCYTQLADTEQEANGLLTADRKPKADPALLRAATTQGRLPVDGSDEFTGEHVGHVRENDQ